MNGQELSFQGLRVVFSQELDSNLVRLPNKVCQLLDQSNIPIQEFGIRINSDAYVGWDGQSSKNFHGSDHILEMNAILAGEYRLQMGQLVDISVKRYGNDTFVNEVYVEPNTFQDWERIDANSAYFQDQILYQTRLVKQRAKLLCFMQNLVCKFTINSISPQDIEVGRLTNDTLVIVSPKVKEENFDNETLVINGSERVVKRTLLGEELIGFTIALKGPQHDYSLVSLVQNPIEGLKEKEGIDGVQPDEICCRVIQDSSLADDDVKVSELLRHVLKLSPTNGYKIKITYVKIPEVAFKVIIHPNSEVSAELEHYIEKLRLLKVLTNGLIVPGGHPFSLDFKNLGKGKKVPFGLVPNEKLIELGESKDLSFTAQKVLSKPAQIVGITEMYHEIINAVKSPLAMSNSFLIQGGAGMGKSIILENLRHDLINSGYHVNYINCDSIPDSTNLAKTKQYISELLHIAYWHAPSIILLDNADSLFSAIKTSEEQPSSSNFYSQPSTKLTQIMMNEAEQIMNKNPDCIKIVMTAKSSESLNKIFSQKQFIGDIWTLKPPTRYQRNDILNQLLQEKDIDLKSDLNIADISIETEGYSPADLRLVVDRFFYELLTSSDTSLTLTRELMESCLTGFTPASLRSVKLQKSTGVKWSDIGGLTNAKRLLLETLEWPTKYAPIFASSPLRLRSGILLYGYPGCGKTMLASAVAQQCGLNFISVKGPEILNKYIGASEQSVRDLFDRAQAAKPCILFFDEFDSIAPKRGHDSTGVTDRVVNQMLTQMDGAEGLDGVYVLAATSRPDLIDSALLRPGRLDKSVICDIPDVTEREDILRAVTLKMDTEDDLDLHEIAIRTEGFTGADLQGMSYNAYLKAVHRSLDAETQEDRQPSAMQEQQQQQQQQQQPQQPIKPQPQRQQNNTHPSSVQQHQQQQHHLQMQHHLQGFYNGVPGVPNGGYYTPSMNPYNNTQQAQQAACMGSNPVSNSIPLASNSGPAGTGTVPTNSHNTANNVSNSSDNGNTNNGSNINVNGNEGIINNEHMTPNSSSSYAINMVAPTQIPSSGQGQAPYSKPSSLSQQFGSIPTYINMNIPNSAPAMPSQRNSQTQIPHNQSAALVQGMLSAPSYSSHLSSNIGVNNMPMNSMNTIPGSNVNGMHHNTNPSFEMSSMDGLYNYQKELLMLEKENKKVLSIAKETSLSSGSTPQFLTLSTSGNAGNKKGSNPMLPPNSSQIATPPNQSPLNVGTAPPATAAAPKKRKYTKRVKDFKKSQSAPNTPNTTALTPGSGNRNNIPSNLNPVYEHLSANNSPRDKTPKGNLVNNSPFTLNTEASTENGKAPAGNKRARKNSSTRQLSVSSTTTTNKPKKVAAKKTPVDITTTPQNNIEEEDSTGASSKDPGSNNSLGLLPHNALTDPTPHTDFDPMSIDPALNASAAFDYADNEDSMLGTLETASLAKKGDTQGDSNDEFAKDEKNSEKMKLDQSGFNLDFLDPNNSYNDFNFLNWQ